MLGNQVYHCEDLGPYWHEWSLLNADMKSSDLQAYLSLVLSKFPTITLAYEGYTIQNSQPIEASASLFFKEIDAYGYLHILPIIHLESYPPGFFEEQDIIKVVHIDETERRLTLSEVVYPRDPAEEFRAILATMGKETKSAVFEEERHFILEGDFAQKFLSLHMGELISKFSLFQASILSKYKVKFSKPTLKLSLGSGIDYFEGDASISVEQEVFTEAVRQRATAVVVAHNHPSGNLEPSMEDKDVTRRLRQAGDILGIKILDHLIFGEEGFLSMLEGNLF